MSIKTIHRACTLCEACCGLSIDVEDNRVVKVRGDDNDVLSRGYVCPKGVAIGELHHDPDRLRTPLVRDASGELVEASWDEALDRAAAGLARVRDTHGKNAVGAYIGNPVIHNHGPLLLRAALMAALNTRNSYSAGSQDTSPRFATSYYLYGSSFALPVPDIDRCDYFFCLGANPVVSNGSAMTAPDMKRRLRELRARGGKVVIIDPRRTETAALADEHHAIRPGNDAALLLAMAAVILREGKADLQGLRSLVTGWESIQKRLAAIDLDQVAAATGLDAATIERLALDFAGAKQAVAYSRVGVCNSRHGTLGTYATDLLNLVAGRLGVVGGAMFTSPAIDLTRVTSQPGYDGHGRWKTRVRGLPETLGDLPTAALAEEIETPGEGQIRGLLTFAGNPVLSAPGGRRIGAALENLEFMVSVDLYVNETTRHADVILPPVWHLAEEHLDVFFPVMTVRNVLSHSPAALEPGPDDRADWEILLALIERLGGGPTGKKPIDALLSALKVFGYRWTPRAAVDLLLRSGRHGDKFLPWSKGLSLAKLESRGEGIDFGPLEPGVSRRVFHKDKKVHLGDALFVDAIDKLLVELGEKPSEALMMIGRRELRTNNSWMHNVPSLMTGRERCVLLVNPNDAQRLHLEDAESAMLEANGHKAEVPLRVSEDVAPGIVCMPHGYGHSELEAWQKVSSARPGVSFNDWTTEEEVEALVGQSILNGVEVSLSRVQPA